tara:strand:- start:1390 stop:1551 length:162 start_codon:yes stop_codon:yes gene_type:complete
VGRLVGAASTRLSKQLKKDLKCLIKAASQSGSGTDRMFDQFVVREIPGADQGA